MTLKRSLALGIIGLALVYSISGFVPVGTLRAETTAMENVRSFLERVGLMEQRPQLAISNNRVYPGGFFGPICSSN